MLILDIALKDLTRSFRSAFAVGMAVVAPLLLVGLMYFAFGGAAGGQQDLAPVTVGLVNADRLPPESALEQSLGESIRSQFFDASVASWISAVDYPDEAAVRAALDQREIGVAVIVPPDFTARTLAGETGAQVLILSDPTLTIAPQVAQNMVNAMLGGVTGGSIAVQTVVERQQAQGLQPDPAQISVLIERYTAWYTNFEQNMFHHPEQAALVMLDPTAQSESVPAMQKMFGAMMAGQMIFFAFFTGAYAMMSILLENEEGTLARLFAAPVDRTAILAGKFLAVFVSVLVQGVVLIIAGHYAFKIEWGSLPAVALALSAQVIAAVGLGAFLISFVKTSRQAGPILGGGLTTLGMLGGLFTTNVAMPEAFKNLAKFTPQGWVIQAWEIVLNGQPLSDLALPLAVLLVLGAGMFAAGAFMFRRRFA